MQMEYDPRPNGHQTHPEYLDRSQPPPVYSNPSSVAVLAQRRRSSAAAHIRPAAPPPNLPIPSVPPSSLANNLAPSPSLDSQETYAQSGSHHINGRGTRSSSFNRPSAPPTSTTAVASSSQIRQSSSAPAAQSALHLAAQSEDDFSDLYSHLPPPPPPYPSSHMAERSNGVATATQSSQSRHLSPPSTEHRPSSRRALTRALELARQAVQLDSTNEDPEAAVNAYAQSVALLSEVMERVRRGEDSTDSRRSRRRRSVAAQEEEIRRLQNIHDTYADRMNILSIIYSIPPVPYTTASLYSSISQSATSTQASSPTASALPSSESSPQIPQPPLTNSINRLQDEAQYNGGDYGRHDANYDGARPNSTAITLDESLLTRNGISGLPPISSQHPYAVQYNPVPQPPQSIPNRDTVSRAPTLSRRSRAISQLPPAPPPPTNSLPPAPTPAVVEPNIDDAFSYHTRPAELTVRSSTDYAARRRSGTGLAALEEEADESRAYISTDGDNANTTRAIATGLETPTRNTKRNSHPLPPLPSPTGSSPDTPQISVYLSKQPPSPRSIPVLPLRPRGASQTTSRSDPVNGALAQPIPIINPNPTQGTIHQRRAKTSITPTSRSASPADHSISAPIPSKQPQPPPLPPIQTANVGRGRSSSQPSQPGRRPSLITGQDQRPPLPASAAVNGVSTRKTSYPPKAAPSNPPILSPVQQGEVVSPGTLTPSLSFQSPPTLSMGITPFAPLSVLPPAPPNDPLRQPYYMMHLLAATMTSQSGGYITRRLHVPNEVWSLPGVKLSNVVEKIRVLDILSSALDDLQLTSSEYFGAGNVSSGMAMGIGSIGDKEASAWLAKLEEFSGVCEGVVGNFGKKLGVGEGFVVKKTTWGDKLSRRFDKFTNAKNIDSPTAYMQNLRKLFHNVQLLDEHTKAVLSQPAAPAYAAFPIEIRSLVEQKLKRASEFFANVVLAFTIRDLALLLDKYVKRCEKLLED